MTMPETSAPTAETAGESVGAEVLRPHAEDAFAGELAALAAADDRPRPAC